jgi:hypothetical protein
MASPLTSPLPGWPAWRPSDVPLEGGRANPNMSPPSPVCIDYAIIEARNPLRLCIPSCLAKVIECFQQHDITPDHMSSNEGLNYADGLPYLVFTKNEMVVNNRTACVMVATSAFSPLSVPPHGSGHHHWDRPCR